MEKIILSVFVPCFNEENNISNALNNIKEGIQNVNYEILIADDASVDKTIEIAEKFKKNNPNVDVKISRNKNNKGLGFNFRATAYRAQGKYYMIVYGDGSLSPSEIKKIVSNIGKADMILTYLIDTRRVFRRTLSRVYSFIINLITLNNIKYYNGPNIHLLENVKLYSQKGSGFGYSAELITAQIRKNVVSRAKEIGYIPTSKTAAKAIFDLTVNSPTIAGSTPSCLGRLATLQSNHRVRPLEECGLVFGFALWQPLGLC